MEEKRGRDGGGNKGELRCGWFKFLKRGDKKIHFAVSAVWKECRV